MIKRLKRKYILVVMLAVVTVLGVIITAINLLSYSGVNSQLDEKLAMIVDNEGKMPDFPPPEIPSFEDEETESDADAEDADEPETDDGETEDDVMGDDGEAAEPDGDEPDSDDSVGDTDTDADGSDVDDEDSDVDPDEKEEEEEEDVRQHMSPETPFETRYFSVKLDTDGTVIETDTAKIVAVDDALAARYAKSVISGKKETGYVSTYRFMKAETENGYICVFIDANRELESFSFFFISSLLISVLGILMVLVIVILLSDVALKPIIESYEKQKRFITDAGHEMKTPLTVITANAEIIEMESGESQWTEGIKSQVSKLASLTEKLVILSKMEEGAKLEMISFSVSDALFDTCDQYKSIAMSKDVSFKLDVSDGVSAVGNEGEIRRCASLLLDNAFRYVDHGGTVEVSLEKHTGGVEMKFTNTTDGVEKGSLDRWFDRFYRTDLSRNSDTGGSGIGLSVVKAIVLAHGGTVKASSPDGIKVEFTIII